MNSILEEGPVEFTDFILIDFNLTNSWLFGTASLENDQYVWPNSVPFCKLLLQLISYFTEKNYTRTINFATVLVHQ